MAFEGIKHFPLIAARYDYASRFVPEGTEGHHGTDIFAPRGSPVIACDDGVARSAEDPKGGHVVYLKASPSAWLKPREWYYAHLDTVNPLIPTGGVEVRGGQMIGTVGTTGNAKGTAPHLHFQMRLKGRLVDPYPFLVEADPQGSGKPAAPGGKIELPDWAKGAGDVAKSWFGAIAGGEAILLLGAIWFLTRDRH